ncbi:major capsid protein [Peromfec virus RodF8_19]|uniref:Major capsid protein n=1 Tax=Peromfec virus RodF8_19 TaxID=2929361 RepID=A0A976R5I4_9VIRU|nr:major capsid protein [Peromfec virus RodF8_19]
MADIIKKSIGKNTLGGGEKMNVNLRTYNRSTHDLSFVWRNTQSPGTLVPFICEPMLPGDTWDINLQAYVMTHPTVGPLFGSFKLQMDVFQCPIRLYQKLLHNNALNIGLDISKVKLPIYQVELTSKDSYKYGTTDITQINPSCLLAYLGNRGYRGTISSTVLAKKMAVPLASYWDIFKNYYANKQEELAYYIGTSELPTAFIVGTSNQNQIINATPGEKTAANVTTGLGFIIQSSTPDASLYEIALKDSNTEEFYWVQLTDTNYIDRYLSTNNAIQFYPKTNLTIYSIKVNDTPYIENFKLENIDTMREMILSADSVAPFVINTTSVKPYSEFANRTANGVLKTAQKQFGLALKTYQSDIFNNWINTEWIDGDGGINEITAISVTDGSFTLDTLNLAQKVYNMLNRIAVSGGTYRDWIETVYTNNYIERTETPTYEGGMSQEIVFQEVVSNSATENEPLGTLAGRGVLSQNRKGGKLVVKCHEPSFLIGICSITPRIDYSQDERFFTDWTTLDDLHKPALDGIGFQDLNEEQIAWWTAGGSSSIPTRTSVGKQPAWLNYMTNYNRVYGNFAAGESENFMILDRNYIPTNENKIDDMSTYIDPAKFNYIFADVTLSAQNFWVQIGVNIESRRKMSNKIIPNL